MMPARYASLLRKTILVSLGIALAACGAKSSKLGVDKPPPSPTVTATAKATPPPKEPHRTINCSLNFAPKQSFANWCAAVWPWIDSSPLAMVKARPIIRRMRRRIYFVKIAASSFPVSTLR